MGYNNILELFLISIESSLWQPGLSSVKNFKRREKQHLLRVETISPFSDNRNHNRITPSSTFLRSHSRKEQAIQNKQVNGNPRLLRLQQNLLLFWLHVDTGETEDKTQDPQKGEECGDGVERWELRSRPRSPPSTLPVVKRGLPSLHSLGKACSPFALRLYSSMHLLYASFRLIPPTSVTAVSASPHFPDTIHMQACTSPVLNRLLTLPQLLRTSHFSLELTGTKHRDPLSHTTSKCSFSLAASEGTPTCRLLQQ